MPTPAGGLRFKLTRLAARFDIDNKAGDSRFTIETVSMGNGRRGSGFLPHTRIRRPAQSQTLLAYHLPGARFLWRECKQRIANRSFDAYPNPKDDKAYMILKGKYKVNETEMKKDVSYQIPFMRQGANGNATWFDIANNHRYTIAITQADAYHLDARDPWETGQTTKASNTPPTTSRGKIVVTIPGIFQRR